MCVALLLEKLQETAAAAKAKEIEVGVYPESALPFDPEEFFAMIRHEQDRKNLETADSFIKDIVRRP